MPVRISTFRPAAPERVEAVRRAKGRHGDPGLDELLTAVESGQPQAIPLDEDQSARGLRNAIARAAGMRGLSVDTYESEDERGQPVVIVVKADRTEPRPTSRRAEAGSGKGRRGRPRKQPQSAMDLEDQAAAIREDEGELATQQDLAGN